MPSKSKKTLIISSYAPPSIGGPQILYNLLRDFPIEAYCILTSFYNIDNVSAQEGTWLRGKYIFYDNPKATRESKQKETLNRNTGDKGRSIITEAKNIAKRLALLRIIGGIPVIVGQIIAIVRQGRKSIKKENVDALLGVSDYGPAMISTYILHKLTQKPYSIYLFDLYKGNFLPFPGGLLASIFESLILKGANKIIVNNQGTKEFYQKRYGDWIDRKLVMIYNLTFPEPYQKLQTPYLPKPPYRIVFTGRINWPQLGSIKNLITAIEGIHDIDILFELYCPMPPKHLERLGIRESQKIKISSASPLETPKIQSKADILFLPLAWDTKSQQIVDTATPAKMVDYLISGRPILVHAPSSTYLVKYTRENDFGAIVDDNNITKLQDSIKKILMDEQYAKHLIKNAQDTFYRNHSPEKNIEVFRSIMFSN